jgi:UDP-galactopyranose mutase
MIEYTKNSASNTEYLIVGSGLSALVFGALMAKAQVKLRLFTI